MKLFGLKVKGLLALTSYVWLLFYDWRIGVPLLLIANGTKKCKCKKKKVTSKREYDSTAN